MRRTALFLVPLFLLACDRDPVAPDISPSLGSANAATQVSQTTSGVWNLCGELVDYTGEFHYVTRLVLGDENHKSHWVLNRHYSLNMVGQVTGNVWKHNETRNAQSQWDDNDYMPDEYFSSNQHIRIIGVGDAPSFDARVMERYTVNANGDVVQEFFRLDPICPS